MAIVIGVDLGTTKITALAIDARTGAVSACCTRLNQAETTTPADKARGYSEWDVVRIVDIACACLGNVAEQLGTLSSDVNGIGITGQQHGMLLVADNLVPLTLFINWQDRRANQNIPGTDQSYVERAIERAGEASLKRTGCRWLTSVPGSKPRCGGRIPI